MFFSRVCLPLFLGFTLSLPARSSVHCRTAVAENLEIRDSSIEIELPLDEKVAHFFTTRNGKVSDLFKSDEQIPIEIKKWASGRSNEILDFAIEDLPVNLRVQLFRSAIVAQKMSFGASAGGGRAVQVIFVKKQYQEKYSLRETFDLGTPSSVEDGKLIELHMRSRLRPGDLALKAKQFQKDLGYKPGPMHMHVVFETPRDWLAKSPRHHAWKIFDFWRRLNLAMEMRDVFENGLSLIHNTMTYKNMNYANFGPAGASAHEGVLKYLISVGNAKNQGGDAEPLKIGSQSKIGWVGFWGHEKYDQPHLFGFEFRFLDGSDLPPNMVNYLNKIPQMIREKEFGPRPPDLESWAMAMDLTSQKEETIYQTLKRIFSNNENFFSENNRGAINEAINPHRTYQELVRNLDFDFQRHLLGINQSVVQQAFNGRGRMRYLIHDWSLDPVLFNQPSLKKKVREAQLRGLRQWARGQDEKSVLQNFLIESGLYLVFAESVGFEI